MVEKQNNKEVSSSVQIICKKLNTERQKSLIETRKKENSTLEQSLRGKLIDNDNNSLTNSKVTDWAISITYKDKEKDELKKETSLIGIIHEEKKRQNINNIKDKEIIKKGMVKEMKEMFERQNSEKLCGKLTTKEDVGKVIRKDMLKENSSFKESLRRKLDTKDEIGKVNKGRKNNNNGNLKEKTNSDSVVKVILWKV